MTCLQSSAWGVPGGAIWRSLWLLSWLGLVPVFAVVGPTQAAPDKPHTQPVPRRRAQAVPTRALPPPARRQSPRSRPTPPRKESRPSRRTRARKATRPRPVVPRDQRARARRYPPFAAPQQAKLWPIYNQSPGQWARYLKQIPIPQDPDWFKVKEQLLSPKPTTRWQALRWLAKQTGPIATDLLALALRHPHVQTRTWAMAAIRDRRDPRVLRVLQQGLQSKSKAIRLNAVVGLGQRQMLSWVKTRLPDPSALVREAACQQIVMYTFVGYPQKQVPISLPAHHHTRHLPPIGTTRKQKSRKSRTNRRKSRTNRRKSRTNRRKSRTNRRKSRASRRKSRVSRRKSRVNRRGARPSRGRATFAPKPRRRPTRRRKKPGARAKLVGGKGPGAALPKPFVTSQMTDGVMVVRPGLSSLQRLLSGCLGDRSTLVRLGTAEVLRSYEPHVPATLRKVYRRVLVMGHRRPRVARTRRRYNAQWRLSRYRTYLRNYRNTLKYRIKRSGGLFDRKRRDCFRRYLGALLGQTEHFERWRKDYLGFLRRGMTQPGQLALSRALLTYRTALLIYRQSNQCQTRYPTYRSERKYRKILRRSLLLPGVPAFIGGRSRMYAVASTSFTFDTAIDVLRHDIHPYTLPEAARVAGPFADGILGGKATFHGDFALSRRLRLVGDVQLGGQFVGGFQQLSGFDGVGRVQLLYGFLNRHRRYVMFVEEELRLTPGLLALDGAPDEFVGRRLVQHFRLGGTWRWGRLHRRWTSWNEWAFHASYQQQIHVPLLEQSLPLTWAPRLNHQLKVELRRQFFFFWFGAKAMLSIDHFLEASAQVPTVQGSGWATFVLGNPYNPVDFMRIEGAVGYGFLAPLSLEGVDPRPTQYQAGTASAPLAYTGVFGHFSRLPIQWRIQYWHQFGNAARPPFGFYTEDRFHGELRFGVPRELEGAFQRRMLFVFGFQASVATYGLDPDEVSPGKPEAKDKANQPRTIRDIALHVQMEYPIVGGLMIVVGNRLSFVRNEFVPYQVANGTPGYDSVRNVLYLKVEYWIGP